MRRCALAALAVALVVVSAVSGSSAPSVRETETDWNVTRQHWYVLTIAGVDCGWMRTALLSDDTHHRTETEMSISLDRGGEPVRITTVTEFVETHAGTPVRLRTLQQMGQDPMETIYEFDASGPVRRITRQGGVESVGEEARPDGGWLPPAAADRFFAMRRDAGATEIVYDTIDGQAGLQVATVRSIRDGEERVEIEGRIVPATRWRIGTSAIPVETTAVFSADGVLLRSRVDLGFGELETRLATEEQVRALRPSRLPDMIVSTMVRPDRPIDDVHRTRRIALRLALPEGASLPELPTVGVQRFERTDVHSGMVRVDRDRPAAATDAELADSAYRSASPTVDSDDELVRTLVGRATRGLDDAAPLERAEACRKFVERHVRDKGLEVAFATASEVARRREGDCSEHAVLLCAMLRADGVASRIASGLIYVDRFGGERNVFGWHMWTQALLEVDVDGERASRWIDLDATLPGGSHAAYVLTGVSALRHGPADSVMTAMLPLLGRLSIEVVEVEHRDSVRPRRPTPSGRPRRRALSARPSGGGADAVGAARIGVKGLGVFGRCSGGCVGRARAGVCSSPVP